ncbi:PD-(D/E)XK nuclease family protein [Streptomyces globisporus]|uniref:PD-(D/E)XK nuclease family protein n=1 Tax=Streptomyces globisporus TaxID=1908 RepID=UPI003684FBE6
MPSTAPDSWTVVAAHVAGLIRPTGDLVRIRVVEVGLGDGSLQITFDGTPNAASANYQTLAIPDIKKIVHAESVTPGYSCKDCKVAGLCGSLEKLSGFLGQPNPGPCTRSVSARDIEIYDTCPTQWHLTRSNHLPRVDANAPASTRGTNVHLALADAHATSGRCSPDGAIGGTTLDSLMSEDEQSEIQPYLAQHSDNCPVEDGARVIGSEIPIYGYDAQADVIIASKPDMLYVDRNQTLVIRETKTTTREVPDSEASAFDQHLAVPWLINLFGSGYRGPFQSATVRLELEVISPAESRVFSWDLRDQGLLRMARKEVAMRVRDWHSDTTWEATPGAHCGWCPVRKWCPAANDDDSPTPENDGL